MQTQNLEGRYDLTVSLVDAFIEDDDGKLELVLRFESKRDANNFLKLISANRSVSAVASGVFVTIKKK